jgi:hypothetical protein
VGTNTGWEARLSRMRRLWNGWFREWNDRNILALQRLRGLLTDENREILDRFAQARNCSLLPRLINLKRAGIRRQSALGNVALLAAAVFNKI